MNRLILSIIVVFVLVGCQLDNEVEAITENVKGKKVWVFTQLNVPEENDKMESYYYYGLISESLYNKISQNELTSGFLLLEKVKFWGNDELIYEYRDIENQGDLLFRIEDIRKLRLIRNEPETGKGYKQFESQPATENIPENQDAAVNKEVPN